LVGLLLLTLLAINPVGSSAYAEEELADDDSNPDAGLSAQAVDVSTVGISFSPTAGSASLAPVNSTGQSAQIKVLATVNVQNSGGYSVYVKSNSQNLAGTKSSANTVPGLQGSSTYANLPVNTWGYTAMEGTTISDNATYKAVSVTGNGDKIAENTGNKITSDTKTIALAFVAKINDTKPADTYKNTVTMSVVSSPMQVTSFADQGITTMQGMTSAICNAVSTGEEAQLRDTRDGKYYWVAKLADGKCWMTQNLDLDLSTSTTLTSATSDVSSNWAPGFNTATSAKTNPAVSSSYTETRSWSLGDYRITNPNTSSYCGTEKDSPADCPDQFTAYTTPTSANGDTNAHYILGNHYQWNAATAGTGGSITTGQAKSSICPKGWRLPTGGSSGEFVVLTTALGGTRPIDYVTEAPFYGAMGGYVGTRGFGLGGSEGHYVSSAPISGSGDADAFVSSLYIYGVSNYIAPSTTNWRYSGSSVRCVAR